MAVCPKEICARMRIIPVGATGRRWPAAGSLVRPAAPHQRLQGQPRNWVRVAGPPARHRAGAAQLRPGIRRGAALGGANHTHWSTAAALKL